MARWRNMFALGDGPWDPSRRLETSWLLPPLAFGLLRLLISLYIFATLFTILALDCSTAATHCAAAGATFSYFTVLTYWGLGFYFLAAAVHTLTYMYDPVLFRSGSNNANNNTNTTTNHPPGPEPGPGTLARLPRSLQAAHVALRTSAVVYPFLVTLVYWAVIYDRAAGFRTSFARWSNASEHGLNSGFALAEVLLARAGPPPALHQLWLLLGLALYLALAYVTRAVQGVYVYAFLDPARHPGRPGVVAGYVFGVAAAALLMFWLSWAAHWARGRVVERRWGMQGKFAPHDRGNVDACGSSGNDCTDASGGDLGLRGGRASRGVDRLPSRHGEGKEATVEEVKVDGYSPV